MCDNGAGGIRRRARDRAGIELGKHRQRAENNDRQQCDRIKALRAHVIPDNCAFCVMAIPPRRRVKFTRT